MKPFSIPSVFRFKAVLFGLLLLVLPVSAGRVPVIPPVPDPPRLVNDYAGILQREAAGLERLLRAFSDSTSNQITIVTLDDLHGHEASQVAYEIGERWGVGNAKYDNGVVILIKPKNRNGAGEVFIAPGYGLEAALPDAVCKRIIDDEMIPYFRADDYASGVISALRVIMPLAAGEITAKEYMPGNEAWLVLASVLLMLGVFTWLAIMAERRKRKGGKGNNGNNTGGPVGPFWFPTGRGASRPGGSFGGFGGFGGGSFGGGGAGGRW